MDACPQTVQAARRRFAAQGLAASRLDSECVTGYSLLASAQGAKLPAIERLVNTTYEKFPYYFPEPELGLVQFNMGIGRRQLPCCSLALTGLNGLPFLPALLSGASWQVFVNRKGFSGESI